MVILVCTDYEKTRIFERGQGMSRLQSFSDVQVTIFQSASSNSIGL